MIDAIAIIALITSGFNLTFMVMFFINQGKINQLQLEFNKTVQDFLKDVFNCIKSNHQDTMDIIELITKKKK